MSKWFYINSIIILFFLWRITEHPFRLTIFFGALGFILFMFNWMRHAMFATLRSKINRKRKIIFAKISKRAMPIHRWTGTFALVCIAIHGILVIREFGFQMNYYKMMFGFMASMMMCIVVISGWIRHIKTTVFKRIFHLTAGFTLFYLIIIHLILKA